MVPRFITYLLALLLVSCAVSGVGCTETPSGTTELTTDETASAPVTTIIDYYYDYDNATETTANSTRLRSTRRRPSTTRSAALPTTTPPPPPPSDFLDQALEQAKNPIILYGAIGGAGAFLFLAIILCCCCYYRCRDRYGGDDDEASKSQKKLKKVKTKVDKKPEEDNSMMKSLPLPIMVGTSSLSSTPPQNQSSPLLKSSSRNLGDMLKSPSSNLDNSKVSSSFGSPMRPSPLGNPYNKARSSSTASQTRRPGDEDRGYNAIMDILKKQNDTESPANGQATENKASAPAKLAVPEPSMTKSASSASAEFSAPTSNAPAPPRPQTRARSSSVKQDVKQMDDILHSLDDMLSGLK